MNPTPEEVFFSGFVVTSGKGWVRGGGGGEGGGGGLKFKVF